MKDSDFNNSGMFDGMNFGMVQFASLSSCAGQRASMALLVVLILFSLEQNKLQYSFNVSINSPRIPNLNLKFSL